MSNTKGFLDLLRGRGVDYGRPQKEGEQREFGNRQDYDDFLDGGLVLNVDSSFLRQAKYNPDKQALGFVFVDGFRCTVLDVSRELASDFLRSPSKGKWYWQHLHGGFNQDRTWNHKLKVLPDVWVDDV